MNELANLTDQQLDQAFAACWDSLDYTASNFYGVEIRDRLASPISFMAGLIGMERFPLYDARVNFDQVNAARASTTTSAENLAADAGDLLSTGIKGAAIFALAAIAVYAYFGKK